MMNNRNNNNKIKFKFFSDNSFIFYLNYLFGNLSAKPCFQIKSFFFFNKLAINLNRLIDTLYEQLKSVEND